MKNHARAGQSHAIPGADVEIIAKNDQTGASFVCHCKHKLYGVKTKLIASIHPGYIIRCPKCGDQIRLLRSEFALTRAEVPKKAHETKSVTSRQRAF